MIRITYACKTNQDLLITDGLCIYSSCMIVCLKDQSKSKQIEHISDQLKMEKAVLSQCSSNYSSFPKDRGMLCKWYQPEIITAFALGAVF